MGVSFAVSFVAFRIIFWPYVSYYFWVDCLAVINNKTAHSLPVVYLFLFANVSLTSLQILWLGEIFKTAFKLFAPEPAKVEGKNGKTNKVKAN